MNGSELDLQTEPIYTWMQHFWNHFYHPGTVLGNAHLESKAFNRAISCNTSAAGIFQRVSVYQDKTTPAPHPSSATQKQTPTTSVEHQVKIEGHIQHGQTIIAHN